MERIVADYLCDNLSEFIDRQVKLGALDVGDISNVRTSYNQKVVVEVKDYGGRLEPPKWLAEAEAERINANAHIGVVVAKRRGVTDPGKQYVLMELDTLVKLLKGDEQ